MHANEPPIDLHELLCAAEDVSPAAAVSAVATHLERMLDAEYVTFWVADAAGRALLSTSADERLPLSDSLAGLAWRDQRIHVDSSVWVPVTVRGDALGVLEIRSPDDIGDHGLTDGLHRALTAVAHCLGYILVANRLHTDSYEVARRSTPFALSMEIQQRLLPQAYICEGGSFALAGWLEPSSTAGGDTFDYIASTDRLTLTLIDAVGHDVRAALLATLTINALRNARRAGADIAEQAAAAQQALGRYGNDEQYVTAVLLDVPLGSVVSGSAGPDEPVVVRAVNAGHPAPRLIRDGRLTRLDLAPEPPLGLDPEGHYDVQEVELLPGDRLVLLTDGMYERSAASLDLDGLLIETATEHPRNAVQDVAAAFRAHIREHIGEPEDDATFLLLDWYGGTTGRSTSGGADH